MVELSRRYKENTSRTAILKILTDLCMVILTAYCLVLFVCSRTVITGSSMEPTINNGIQVLINKGAYAIFSPSRYDVIAFESNNSEKIYVKRIVGLPGESIQIVDGKIYINGAILSDDVINTDILTGGIASTSIKLAEDEYFVLGDNRNNSEDSRFSTIGTVKSKDILGKVWFKAFPMKSMGLVR